MEQGPGPRLAFEQTLDKLSLCHTKPFLLPGGQAGSMMWWCGLVSLWQTNLPLVTALLITGQDF